MPRSLSSLFSIAPGEERKTALLYSLHLVFYLGLMWGDAARETLFLSAWSADDLALVFVAYAVLGFAIGLAYAFFADRISNGRLLKIIMGVMVVWLLSVRIMLITNGGQHGAVYPYFYLAYSAFRDLSTMHILTYINDFYDTRAAKRALPLMLSAGIAGGTISGFTTTLLNKWVGLENTPLVWTGCLIICFIFVLIIERQLHVDLEQIERRRQQISAAARKDVKQSGWSGFQNLRQGFAFVRNSGLLRGVAVATFVLVLLMNLLIYQSSRVFASQFANNSAGLFGFYGTLGGISNIGGLLIQSLFLSRLINWLGVGTMNLFFPIVTLGSIAAINALPGMATGIFARLDHSMIKQTFRNPLDAMLYNSVPVKNKARARGFVNGVMVPAGTLVAGLIILAAKSKLLTGPVLLGIGVGVGLIYVIIMFTVRREYARSMTSLLAGDDIAILLQDQAEVLPPNPATVAWLQKKLLSLPMDESADGQAVFISQVLYDMDARAALPAMFKMVDQRGSFYLKGMIESLDKANLDRDDFVDLCQNNLDHPEPAVREAAARALLNLIKRDYSRRGGIGPGAPILNSLYEHLGELQFDEQTELFILLLQSGSPEQKLRVQNILDGWLETTGKESSAVPVEGNAPVLEAGLIVLAETERQKLKELAGRIAKHTDPYVRIQVIPALIRESRRTHWDGKSWSVQILVSLLEDPEEHVRQTMIEELLEGAESIPLKPVVWQALNDPSPLVRQLACSLPIHLKLPEVRALRGCLETNVLQTAPGRGESAIYLLIRANQAAVSASLGKAADSLVRDAYWLALQGLALNDLAKVEKAPRPGARLMVKAYQEASQSVLEQVFWLMSAYSSEEEVQAVRRALPSSDPAERANAAEALEATLPPAVARRLRHLVDDSPAAEIIACAEQEFGLQLPGLMQVLQNAWPQLDQANAVPDVPAHLQTFYSDGWLTATAIYLVNEARLPGQAVADISIPPDALREALLHTLETDSRPNVKEAASLALNQLDSTEKDIPMSTDQPLTLIEKVIFLKDVPFFSGLALQEICILAGISEEVSYPAEHKIFSQGDTTKTLYLIIKGRVSVQQPTRTGSIVRLSTLGAKNYFAETSLFDGAPHQADIVTIEAVDILLIRQSTLFALIRRRPDIGLSLLKSLSQRLRETYAQVAQAERAKPQKLVSLYDKLEG
jgi:hypothetical protein